MLAFPFVGRQFEHAAIAEVKSFINIEDCLHPVVACGEIVEALGGIPECRWVDHGGHAGCECVDIDAKDLLRIRRHETDLEARLLFVVVREQEQDMAVERSRAHFFRKRDFKARAHRLKGRLYSCSLGCGRA